MKISDPVAMPEDTVLVLNYRMKPPAWEVNVRRGASSLFFVASGAFLYQSEGAEGSWLRMDVPELPGGEE